jgi:ribosomal protein L15
MSNQKYTEITSAVYKILDFFPEEEPLKNKAKEKALKILENLTLASNALQKSQAAGQALEDIEILKNYLVLGKERGWIDNMNLMILSKEYDEIVEEIKPLAKLITGGKTAEIPVDNNVKKSTARPGLAVLSGRQKEIIRILGAQGKAQVADFKKALPEVTKRTLRRDLDELLKIGKVERIGEWNQVFYQLHEIARCPTSGKLDGTALMSQQT